MSKQQKTCAMWRQAANEQARRMQQRLQMFVCDVSQCIWLQSAPLKSYGLYNLNLI